MSSLCSARLRIKSSVMRTIIFYTNFLLYDFSLQNSIFSENHFFRQWHQNEINKEFTMTHCAKWVIIRQFSPPWWVIANNEHFQKMTIFKNSRFAIFSSFSFLSKSVFLYPKKHVFLQIKCRLKKIKTVPLPHFWPKVTRYVVRGSLIRAVRTVRDWVSRCKWPCILAIFERWIWKGACTVHKCFGNKARWQDCSCGS